VWNVELMCYWLSDVLVNRSPNSVKLSVHASVVFVCFFCTSAGSISIRCQDRSVRAGKIGASLAARSFLEYIV
jgi:hypothetical protein